MRGSCDRCSSSSSGKNVLAVRQNDDVFLATGNENVAVVVNIANVSGTEPAIIVEILHVVRESRLRRRFILVVPEHDVRTLDDDLAEILRRILVDPHLFVVNRLARPSRISPRRSG